MTTTHQDHIAVARPRSTSGVIRDGPPAELRALMLACGPEANRHDLGTVLIGACIENGVDTVGGIIRALAPLGFNGGHVALLLREGCGDDPERRLWRRDAERRYTLLPQPAVPA